MRLMHLNDFNDMSMDDWREVLATAKDIIRAPLRYSEACKGRILATAFYEPSTRTRFSFQAAMLRLGGTFLGFSDPYNSSVSKGESLRDTTKIMCGYADAVVIRHPRAGAARAAQMYASRPVINAGDGEHLHPTQTLTDLLTINELKGRSSGLSIGLCGDLRNGRTVHSLIKALTRFEDNRYYLISTPQLRLPDYIIETLNATRSEFHEVDSIEECIGKLDILYMTRIQKERFSSEEEYLSQSGVYILDEGKMKFARDDMIVMHPLPKVDEITDSVENDPRAVYFRQAEYGMYVRMALLYRLISGAGAYDVAPPPSNSGGLVCQNKNCITMTERYLPQRIKPSHVIGEQVCEYCEHPMDADGEAL